MRAYQWGMERPVYERMRSLERTHWWFVGRRRILSRLIGDLGLPPEARLLEAGCGVGGNIEMLRQFGALEALEPDGPSRDYIRDRYDLTPASGRLPDELPYDPESFDAIFALDVVEHVQEDAAAVSALARLLRPGGLLLLTVPAYDWMWSAHDERHHHKRRYTRARVEALFAQAGLGCVRASYFNTLLFAPAALVRGLKRLLRLTGEDDALPPAPVNSVMRALFSAEAHWLRRASLPFGLSILGVARREAA